MCTVKITWPHSSGLASSFTAASALPICDLQDPGNVAGCSQPQRQLWLFGPGSVAACLWDGARVSCPRCVVQLLITCFFSPLPSRSFYTSVTMLHEGQAAPGHGALRGPRSEHKGGTRRPQGGWEEQHGEERDGVAVWPASQVFRSPVRKQWL